MVSKKVSFLILGRTRRKRRRKLSLLEARISNEAFEWRRKETKNKKDGGRKGNGQQLDRYGHPTQKKRDRQTERERMSISLFSHFAKAKWWAFWASRLKICHKMCTILAQTLSAFSEQAILTKCKFIVQFFSV